MKPGRELDALIAMKVMGWKPFKKRWEGIHGGFLDRWLDKDGQEIQGETPRYSTDIAAAWNLVDKFQERMNVDINIDGGGWRAEFGNHGQVECDTAPHAICLAALKAVGHEIIKKQP